MGRLVYINNAISEGAREAARWGSVQSRTGTAAGRTAIQAKPGNSLPTVPDPVLTTARQSNHDRT